jgi:hypothetical protein
MDGLDYPITNLFQPVKVQSARVYDGLNRDFFLFFIWNRSNLNRRTGTNLSPILTRNPKEFGPDHTVIKSLFEGTMSENSSIFLYISTTLGFQTYNLNTKDRMLFIFF